MYLRVGWFGLNPADDARELFNRLPIPDGCAYTRRNGIQGTQVSKAGKILE